MACVEDYWFSHWLHGNDETPPWDTLEWDDVFVYAASDAPGELRQLWGDAVERSRTLVADALATGGLDQRAKRSFKSGESPNLRWIIVHMID